MYGVCSNMYGQTTIYWYSFIVRLSVLVYRTFIGTRFSRHYSAMRFFLVEKSQIQGSRRWLSLTKLD